jgi:hypothetical protein
MHRAFPILYRAQCARSFLIGEQLEPEDHDGGSTPHMGVWEKRHRKEFSSCL